MISTIAGIISAVGKFFSFTIRNPVASIRNPPQALKSLIIPVLSAGKSPLPQKQNQEIITCGIAIMHTTIPRLHAKIAAVNKSRIDLESIQNDLTHTGYDRTINSGSAGTEQYDIVTKVFINSSSDISEFEFLINLLITLCIAPAPTLIFSPR